MAKKTVGNLNVLLTLSARGFTSGISGAIKGLHNLSRVTSFASRQIFNFRNLLIAGTGAAMAKWIDSNLQAVDAQIDMAKTLNASVEGLQALQLVATEAGIETDQLNTSLSFMSKTLGAVGGNKKLIAVFKELNLTWKDLKGLKADEQMQLISERLGDVTDANRRAAMASQIFGRGGVKLNQILTDQSEKLQEARMWLQQTGLAWNQKLNPGIERANDALQRAKMFFTGIGRQIAIQLAPTIERLSNAFVNWGITAGGAGRVAEKALSGFLTIMQDSVAWLSLLRIQLAEVAVLWAKLSAGLTSSTVEFNSMMGVDPNTGNPYGGKKTRAAGPGLTRTDSMQGATNVADAMRALEDAKASQWAPEVIGKLEEIKREIQRNNVLTDKTRGVQ